MTEEENQEIRAAFAGKRVSQMTLVERRVFNEDFQYGVRATQKEEARPFDPPKSQKKSNSVTSVLRRLGLVHNQS